MKWTHRTTGGIHDESRIVAPQGVFSSHLQPATKTWPEDPLGPDRLLGADQHRKTWPYRQDVPMHFAHPKFGAILAGQE